MVDYSTEGNINVACQDIILNRNVRRHLLISMSATKYNVPVLRDTFINMDICELVSE